MCRDRRRHYDDGFMRVVADLIRGGAGRRSLARRLGVPVSTVGKWVLSYRFGGEAALMGEREGNRRYDYETKLAAVRDHVEHGLTKAEVMEKYRIAGPAPLERWCREYRCFASMFVRQVRQCFSAVWADGFPRCRHRFPVM